MVSIVCRLRQTRLVVDWHNFGYSILALKLGTGHPLVRFSSWYEKVFCTSAFAHLCVTEAMVRVLRSEFPIPKRTPILALHDRPARHFQLVLDENHRRSFLLSLPECKPAFSDLRDGRSKVLVSSTSWTADEDFSLLIDALCRYSELASSTTTSNKKPSKHSLPPVLVIITGKGPQKQRYIDEIESLNKAGRLENVTIQTAWLSTSDYAKLLACADLGISLHTSSSGVDLPMKVVDMFGAGLPVVGWNRFEAWPELVTENVNGRGFGSVDQLVQCLVELLGSESHELSQLRQGAMKEGKRRWEDEWDPIAGKLFGLVA
jgi:beta-1,4-mannosyltransferase